MKPEDILALQRVVMTMNAGCCPSCGVVTAPGGMRVDAIGQTDFPEWHGLKCDLCGFSVTDNQVRLVAMLKPWAADLAVWQTWAVANPK